MKKNQGRHYELEEHLISGNTVLYVVNIETFLKTKSFQIDGKRTKASVVEQQTGEKEIYFSKK